MKPLQYSIYKGMSGRWGAVQLNLQAPHYHKGKQKDYIGNEALINGLPKDGWKAREGAVFIEITSTKDQNVYDWENKIVLALSSTDIGKVLHCLYTGQECKIMHDPNAKSQSQGLIRKNLLISSPKGTANGCMIRATQTSGGHQRNHSVPLSGDELIVLKELLQASIPIVFGWN
jgi:hypothetical protein